MFGFDKFKEAWISIHPPREGWDPDSVIDGFQQGISIHPPREGWDERIAFRA